MRFIDEFRDTAAASGLLQELHRVPLDRPVTFMEVCGTHTMAISRLGLRPLLPPDMGLVSGPGCPVCVTPTSYLDRALALATLPGVTIATFGDLLRVPGSCSSLELSRAEGRDIRVVYSCLDALALARHQPDRTVVFLGVGFETTAPTVAACLLDARAEGRTNFLVLCGHKVMPAPMRALMETPSVALRGFLCPGHVSTVIGSDAYGFLASDFGASCVVAGFEPLDLLQALVMLARQVSEKRAEVENAYSRAVTARGNLVAQRLMAEAFQLGPAEWRGFGRIPDSGLSIGPGLEHLDASVVLPVDVPETRDDPACRCPDVLRGLATPTDCPLFSRSCTPISPRGACMVSSEGTCAAYFRYERHGYSGAKGPER